MRRLALVFLLLCLPALAWSATTYVATNGNNGNPCGAGSGSPRRDIAAALGCINPGDTLYIRGGTYFETLDDCGGTIMPSGTSWSNPTTVAGYPGETVTIVAPGGSDYVISTQCQGMRYIIIDNLHLDGSNVNYHVSKLGGDHIRFQNSELNGADHASTGILTGAPFIELLNLDIHNTLEYCIYKTGEGGILDGLNLHDSGGTALHLYADGGGVNNNIFRNSRVHNNGFHQKNCFGGCVMPGIILSSGTGNLAYNNLIYHNGIAGILVTWGGDQTGVYNNTIYDNGAECIDIENSTNTIFRNNICYNNASNITDGTGGSYSQDHNTFNGTNPLFVNAGAADFHLQSTSSPAYNTGVTIGAVSTDFDGNARPQGGVYDIGAYEFGGAPPPPPPTTPLVAHWMFDTVSGATTPDATGNGHTLTLAGGPTLVAGKVGTNAMSFATVGATATLPDAFAFSTYSWTLWLKMPTASRDDQYEICFRNGSGINFGLAWSRAVVGHKPSALHRQADGAIMYVPVANTLQAGVWYHFATTWDGTTLRIYLNGALQAATALAGIFTTTGPQFLLSDTTEGCLGTFDDMRIYSVVLTQAEITALQPVAPKRISHRALMGR